VKASLLGSSISDSPGFEFEDCDVKKNEGFHDGEEDDDDGARTRLSWQFWHSLRRGLAFPSNAKGDLTYMDDGEEDEDDGARRTKASRR
jgi:hypothetical protein